jgi:hypothetical protein
MADMVFELTGEHFRRRYSLYVIELSHEGNQYFYVGQTGDTRVITARPVFRRLAAHFEDRKSTQNQLYQYVAHDILKCPEDEGKKRAFTERTRQAVEECLVKSNIRMYVYHLEPFLSTTAEEHKKRRRKTQKIEKQVIDIFHKNGKRLMNRKVPLSVCSKCPYPEVLKRVTRDFDLRIERG